MNLYRRAWIATLLALIIATLCELTMAQESSLSPKRDINAVLADHDKQLLAIPNVVGVYVAVLADGKTPCLKVMLSKKTAETERAIPRSLEGYPVVAEVTGDIRPLGH